MATYTDIVILLAIVAGLIWVLRITLRSRRSSRAHVPPVSEQWLAERRSKQD